MSPEAHVTRPPRLGMSVAIFLLGFLTAYRPIAGMDFHWHLGMGRAYLEHGPRLDVDPHTHLPLVRAPDMGEWGGQVTFALLDRAGGVTAIRVMLAAVFGGACLLTAALARRRTACVELVWLAVAVFIAAALLRIRGRPDVFSIAGVLVLLGLLDRAPSRRTTALFAALGLVWVNLHPGVVAAPALTALTAFGGRVRARLVQAAALALGACVSPRGPFTTVEIAWRTVRTGPLVPEFRSPFVQDPAAFADEWCLLAGVAATVVWAATRRPRGAGALALAAAGLAMAARSTRLLYMLAPAFLAALPALDRAVRARPPRRRAAAALAAVLVLAFPVRDRLAAAASARDVGLSPFADLYEPRYPVEATRFLAAYDLRGNLFHPVGWGGYLGLHLAPRYRTAHDGRITLFGRELAEELLEFNDPRMRRVLTERLALEILVVPHSMIPRDDPRWVVVHSDPVAVVLIDSRGPNAEHNAAALKSR